MTETEQEWSRYFMGPLTEILSCIYTGSVLQ